MSECKIDKNISLDLCVFERPDLTKQIEMLFVSGFIDYKFMSTLMDFNKDGLLRATIDNEKPDDIILYKGDMTETVMLIVGTNISKQVTDYFIENDLPL